MEFFVGMAKPDEASSSPVSNGSVFALPFSSKIGSGVKFTVTQKIRQSKKSSLFLFQLSI